MIYQFRWRLACLVATLIHQASIYRIIHKSQACSIRNDRHDVTSSSYSRRNRTWWYGLRLLLEYGLEFEVQGQSSSPGGSRPHSSWHYVFKRRRSYWVFMINYWLYPDILRVRATLWTANHYYSLSRSALFVSWDCKELPTLPKQPLRTSTVDNLESERLHRRGIMFGLFPTYLLYIYIYRQRYLSSINSWDWFNPSTSHYSPPLPTWVRTGSYILPINCLETHINIGVIIMGK